MNYRYLKGGGLRGGGRLAGAAHFARMPVERAESAAGRVLMGGREFPPDHKAGEDPTAAL